jgi:hypothetical protein
MKICQKKIIALSLQNAILENIESWFTETDLINCSNTKNYIKQFIKNNSSANNPMNCIFLINDTILGISNKNNSSKIKYCDFLIDDLMVLQPISLTQLESYRSVIIDWIFNHHLKNELAFKAIQSLQEFEANKHQFSNFSSCVCVIDALDLGFKLNDFIRLNQKFKVIHQFFITHYKTDTILKNVNLTKVFFIDQLVLGFTFQMEESAKEHFFWNKQLDEQLLLMDKITFDKPIQLTVDGLLDKIHLKGIESLTETEINFLNNQ